MYVTIYGRSEELVSRCAECQLAEPESLPSLGGSAPGVFDGILSLYKTSTQLRTSLDLTLVPLKGRPPVDVPQGDATVH